MGTQVFDDGSTLTTDAEGNVAGFTPSWEWSPSNYGSSFSASALNPNADKIADIFKTGISRLADYGTARLQIQNQTASRVTPAYNQLAMGGAAIGSGGLMLSPLVLLLVGGLVFFAMRKG